MNQLTTNLSSRAERRAAAKLAGIPSGDRPGCPTGEGLS